MLLGLRFVKDVGAASSELIVEERERCGPYAGAADLVRRTGLKPQSVESLVMAGAFDSINPNRRQALWDAGLGIRPGRNGQRAFLGAVNGDAPGLPTLLPTRGWPASNGSWAFIPRATSWSSCGST